jgi:hypothetical protein
MLGLGSMLSLGRFLLLVAAFPFMLGCDQDPFGLSERTVKGDYRLMQWEDGVTYYLVGGPHIDNGGGAIDGTVVRLGWDQQRILVERYANFRGDGDGFMVVDLQTIRGPLSAREVATNADLSRIKLMPPKEAWEVLGR